MYLFSPTRWLQRLSVSSKFYVITGLIGLVLLSGLVGFAFSMVTMSAIRAYVGGEGLWSKAQKEAVNSLIRYADLHDEADYDRFLGALQVPLGDKAARIEMDKSNPDYTLVRNGFLQGGNDPADLDSLIFLYRYFHSAQYLASAIQIWSEADVGIAQLLQTGAQVHDLVTQDAGSDTAAAAHTAALAAALDQAERIDANLTTLENHFSATLGVGSRAVGWILLLIFTISTLIFGFIALRVALFLGASIAEVDKAKSEFVSLASHQLRTPLTAIAWSAERLLSPHVGALNEKQREYFSRIRQNNHRMIELVNSLLNVSRVEMGSFIIDPVESDIRELISDVLLALRPAATEKQIRFVERYSAETIRVSVDRELFRTIVQNLVTNAMHYSPPGSAVTVGASVESAGSTIGGETLDAESLVFQVSDQGLGIPPRQQKKIFTKLFRADNAVSHYTDGTGLGLYLTKAILDSSGGSIWFESEEGRGSVFYVSIPATGMRSVATGKKLLESINSQLLPGGEEQGILK